MEGPECPLLVSLASLPLYTSFFPLQNYFLGFLIHMAENRAETKVRQVRCSI